MSFLIIFANFFDYLRLCACGFNNNNNNKTYSNVLLLQYSALFGSFARCFDYRYTGTIFVQFHLLFLALVSYKPWGQSK